jgi:uncharacterized protein (DUF1697 family)
MTRYIPLFGSINVGGNRLTMANLPRCEREDWKDWRAVIARSISTMWRRGARPMRTEE